MTPVRRRNNLILYLVIFLGFVGGYVYYSRSSDMAGVPPLPITSKEIQELKNLKVNFQALQDDQYRSLRIYGEFPVNPGSSGKQDLFAPF